MPRSIFDKLFSGKSGIVQSLVTNYGAECNISYNTRSSRNMLDNTVNDAGEVSYDIVATPALRLKQFERFETDNSLISQSDSYCIIPLFDKTGATIEKPPLNATVTFPTGDKFNISDVENYNSGYETAGYKLILRSI